MSHFGNFFFLGRLYQNLIIQKGAGQHRLGVAAGCVGKSIEVDVASEEGTMRDSVVGGARSESREGEGDSLNSGKLVRAYSETSCLINGG